MATAGLLLKQGHDAAYHRAQVLACEVHLHFAGLDLVDVEHGVDQADKALAGRGRLFQCVLFVRAETVLQTFGKHGVVTEDDAEGGAQFVRGDALEFRFERIQLAQFFVGGGDLLVIELEFRES